MSRKAAAQAARRSRSRGKALMRRSSSSVGVIVASMIDRTLRLSRFAARAASARPGLVDELVERGAAPIARAEMEAALAGPEAEIARRTRRLRERVLFTLA